MLTGGKTAGVLYEFWAAEAALPFGRIRFFFGDERCVPPDSEDSNYGLVMRTLLPSPIPAGCGIERIHAELADRGAEARRYGRRLPRSVDVLLLGVGLDGHVASLFPDDRVLEETGTSVAAVVGPDLPFQRLTITPAVIKGARDVFLLATGAEKGEMLGEALMDPSDVAAMPVRLTIGGTWILDGEAVRSLERICGNLAT